MPSIRRPIWLAAGLAAAMLSPIQPQAQGPSAAFNRDTIVLDPAHGGPDGGARINESLVEKDVNLQLATRLRSLLTARGFTVISTRDIATGDDASGKALTSTQRAELTNKAHAVACIVVHATGSGSGVHIGASSLGSPIASTPAGPARASGAVSWDRAQEAWVTQSLRLANQVGAALSRSNISLAIERVALRPLDNLMCPAISVELAPQQRDGQDTVPVSNGDYQQQVAAALAGALVFWRNQAQQPEYIPVPRPTGRLIDPLPDPARRIEPGT